MKVSDTPLTPGNVADISMAVPLLIAAAPACRLITDKAYDADSLRRWFAERRIKAVIPSTASRRTLYLLDTRIYRRRIVIERLFCRLKNWRRIAIRYGRHATKHIAARSQSPASVVLGLCGSPQPPKTS
ncbi:transposase [Sphingomonas profundi]|uniref:transposase n=1 Tax=Alterirhizorhabdus profundi TaxID=2681549 RepID=UPI0024111F52|nr:transposase [Sphingomonas profundi]